MKRFLKTVAALLLTSVLIVSLFPAAVFADEEETTVATETIVEVEDATTVNNNASTDVTTAGDAAGETENKEQEDPAPPAEPEGQAQEVAPAEPVEPATQAAPVEPAAPAKNTITSQPADAIVAPGKSAKFSVAVNGSVKKYQWQYSTNGRTWKNLGSKAEVSVKASTSKSNNNNGYQYRCIVTFNDKTQVTSDAATLYVASAQSFKTDKNSTAENADVSVSAPAGTFPTGTAMAVEDVEAGDCIDAINSILDVEADAVTAVDISFAYQGDEIEPANGNKVTVTLKSDAVNPGVTLVHIDDDGIATIVDEEDIESIKDGEIVFKSDAFSVYAVVATGFTNNQEYVIYSGTTALILSGGSVSSATVTVEVVDGQTIVRSDNDDITWTATRNGGATSTNYRLHRGNSYLRARQTQGLDIRTNGNNDCNWVYSSYSHTLTRGNLYLTLNGTTWGVTTDAYQAAEVYIALVQDEPKDFTYYYYNADTSNPAIVAASEPATTVTTSWTNVSTLAKEISGYTFLEARANSRTGDIISQVNGRAYRTVGQTTGNGSDLDEIYFVYMRDYVAGEDVIPGLNGPITEKKVSEQNEDGTFTIQLDVTGVVNEVKHGANVIIVFDRTSSMSGVMKAATATDPGDDTMRINAAISAVNTLVTTLNPGDPSIEGFYDIDFALVEFDRNASAYDFGTNGIAGHTQWTKSGTALTQRVGRYQNGNNLAASGATPGAGGTNWQEALQVTASVLENKPDADPTYVVFMTDGEPTFYIGSTTVRNNRSTTDPEYYASVPYATAIVDADYRMYDIFCSASSTTLLESLYTTSGADSYVMAETQSAIEDAFAQVASDMLDAIGSSNYGVNDGVPSMGSFDLDTVEGEVQLGSARYYIKTADSEEFVDWEDAPVATPSASGVLWDLSDVGTLSGGTVYRIEFEVWPKQAAYDLIADLNNQKIFYDFATYQANGGELPTEEEAIAAGKVITADQRSQITQVTDTTYTLKTNTTLSATYKLYGNTIVEDGIDFTPEAMDLPTETISVKKLWPENMLDDYGEAIYRAEDGSAQSASEIKLTLERGGEEYLEIIVDKYGPDGQQKGTDPETGKDYAEDNWSKDDIYVSNGFMTVETVTDPETGATSKVAHIKETGHDYQIVEPEEFLYYWDLISDIYHPMVINGVATVLVYDPDLKEADVDNENVFAIGENEDGTARIYYKQADTSGNTLEASNYRRSNLNLYKVIPAEDDSAYFTYTATVKDSYSTDGFVWFSAYEPVRDEEGNPVTVTDDDGKVTIKSQVVYEDWVLSGAEPEQKALELGANAAHDVQYHEADDDHPYNYFSYYWRTGTTLYEVPAVNDDIAAPMYKTGYYKAANGATITFKIKGGYEDDDISALGWDNFPGWNIRFLNLYHGSTFSFEETDMPGNYEFVEVNAKTYWPIMLESNKDWFTIDEESETGLITGKITEPNNNYKIAYSNAPKQEFYIYHSGVAGNGNLETISIPKEGEALTGNWNGDGTYNLFAHTTEGTLYGGYYLDYELKGTYADDGVPGEDGVVYTGMNTEKWGDCKPQTVDGTKMIPVAGETYYIKEVPTYYLRNYHQITYVKSSGKLTALYLLSAVDDLNYSESGFVIASGDGTEANIVSSLTFRNTATNKMVTLKANTIFASKGITGEGSEKDYLTYINVTNTEFFKANTTFTVLPYWITPDKITVNGIGTRTIKITTLTKSGISKTGD